VSSTTYYEVYSSDGVAPTLGMANLYDGQTLSGSSCTFAVVANDDHAVRRIDQYIDYVYRTTTTCQDITYNCVPSYPRSRGMTGQHAETFEAYDWLGNRGVLTSLFTRELGRAEVPSRPARVTASRPYTRGRPRRAALSGSSLPPNSGIDDDGAGVGPRMDAGS
jgi:hypothetical protein